MSKFPNLRLHNRALEAPQVTGGEDMTPEGLFLAAVLAAHLESTTFAELARDLREHGKAYPDEVEAIVAAFAEFLRRDPVAS